MDSESNNIDLQHLEHIQIGSDHFSNILKNKILMKNSKKDFNHLIKELVARILEGEGAASQDQRRSSFNNSILTEPLKTLVGKVALSSSKITGSDFDEAKKTGFIEDQIFELVICAAVGQASR